MDTKILTLGNLYARRDWGHAKHGVGQCGKYIKKLTIMLFLLIHHSVKDFVNICSKKLGMNIIWKIKA